MSNYGILHLPESKYINEPKEDFLDWHFSNSNHHIQIIKWWDTWREKKFSSLPFKRRVDSFMALALRSQELFSYAMYIFMSEYAFFLNLCKCSYPAQAFIVFHGNIISLYITSYLKLPESYGEWLELGLPGGFSWITYFSFQLFQRILLHSANAFKVFRNKMV